MLNIDDRLDFLHIDEDGTSRVPWLLFLGNSHSSHLPFRRCRMENGTARHVLGYFDGDGLPQQVARWELAPATLADDERFVWRV